MAKFLVQIFGKVPDSLIVEAENARMAEEEALDQIMDELNLEAELIEEDQQT